MQFVKAFREFIRWEIVLAAAILLAVISMFMIHPDAEYLGYIDGYTIILLFSLMCVMAGFQELGIFRRIGNVLLGKVRNSRQLMGVLIFLPFFFSMVITNDVALITFVPFAITVLRMSKQERLVIPVVVLQTIGANMGSMLTPIGNPQNLYLYELSGLCADRDACI